MELNDTESTSNCTVVKPVFYCPETPNFTWDLENTTTLAWSSLVIRCIACPCIILMNTLVIITMKKKKVLQKQSTILLSSLAVTDLLTGAVCIPLSVVVDVLILRQITFAHICILDSLTCFGNFLSICSLYHLTVIAWERYVAIRKWIDYKVIVTARRVKKLAIAGWLSTIFISVPGLVLRQTGLDDNAVIVSWYMGEGILGIMLLILLVYLYTLVYLGVRKRNINQFQISQVTTLVKAKMEAKIAKTTALLTAVMILCYVPMGIVLSLGDILPVLRTNSGFRSAETIMHLNSLMNPLLYSYRYRRFRTALLELVGMRKPKAIHPAVTAVRSVGRKVPRGSPEDVLEVKKAEKRTRLFRSESCHSVTVLDCVHRNNGLMLKRSAMSAPTLQ